MAPARRGPRERSGGGDTGAESPVIAMLTRTRLLAWLLVLGLACPLPATAPSAAPPAAQPSGGPEAAFTPEQLEQVAAPIALYPDPLLAQVLMASTYPLEIVQAARFVKSNPDLKGDRLNEKLKEQTWDDSVKSLVSFPQVLDLMNEKLDWTQKLGDAFLADEKGCWTPSSACGLTRRPPAI
jgi:hypothetical protein